jgi:hypothetical protein
MALWVCRVLNSNPPLWRQQTISLRITGSSPALTSCHLQLHHRPWPQRTTSGSHHYLSSTPHPSGTPFLMTRWRPCWPKFALRWRTFVHAIDWKSTCGKIAWSVAWALQRHLTVQCPCRWTNSSGICRCSVDSSLSAPPK